MPVSALADGESGDGIKAEQLVFNVHDDAPILDLSEIKNELRSDASWEGHIDYSFGADNGDARSIVLSREDASGFKAEGVYDSTSNSYSFAVNGAKLVLKENGDFVYDGNLNSETASAPDELEAAYKLTITDNDGDYKTETVTVKFTRTIPSLSVNDSKIVLEEPYLDNGCDPKAAMLEGNGIFDINLNGENGILRIGEENNALTFRLSEGAGAEPYPATDASRTITVSGVEITFDDISQPQGEEGWKVRYSYKLIEAQPHDQPDNDEKITTSIPVTITDDTGEDSASGQLSVTVVDDMPLIDIADTELSTTATSKSVNSHVDFMYGADEEGSITVNGVTGTETAGGTEFVIQGVGSVLLKAGGDFTFEAENSVTGEQTVQFVVTDSDGDSDKASVKITVLETPPALTVYGDTVVLDEGALDAGSKAHAEHGAEQTGSIRVDLHGEDGTIQLSDNGQMVTMTVQGVTAGIKGNASLSVNNVEISFTVPTAQNNDGSWTFDYKAVVSGGAQHNDNASSGADDTLDGTVDILVTDEDNQIAKGNISVSLHDDAPDTYTNGSIAKDIVQTGTDPYGGPAYTSAGQLALKNGAESSFIFGADGAGTTEIVVHYGSQDILYTYDVATGEHRTTDSSAEMNGAAITLFTDTGSTIVIDMTSGTYLYTAASLDAAIKGEQLGIRYTIADNDGDTSSAGTTLAFKPYPNLLTEDDEADTMQTFSDENVNGSEDEIVDEELSTEPSFDGESESEIANETEIEAAGESEIAGESETGSGAGEAPSAGYAETEKDKSAESDMQNAAPASESESDVSPDSVESKSSDAAGAEGSAKAPDMADVFDNADSAADTDAPKETQSADVQDDNSVQPDAVPADEMSFAVSQEVTWQNASGSTYSRQNSFVMLSGASETTDAGYGSGVVQNRSPVLAPYISSDKALKADIELGTKEHAIDEGALDSGTGIHSEHGTMGQGSFKVNLYGDDGILNIDSLSFALKDGTAVSVPGSAVVTKDGIEMTITNITQGSDGKWEVSYDYKLTDALTHPDTAKSGEDDTVSVAIDITVESTPIEQEGLIDTIILDEGALNNGTGIHSEHGSAGSGSFKVNLHRENGTIQIGDLIFNVVEGKEITVPGEASVHQNGVLLSISTITQDDDGKWSVSYKYALSEAQIHGAPGSETDESLVGQIAVKVEDANRSGATGYLSVQVHDDIPAIYGLTAGENGSKNVTINAVESINGKLEFTYGADDGNGKSIALEGAASEDGKTFIFDNGSKLVLEDDGNYTFTSGKSANGEQILKFIVTDRDGDKAEQSVTVLIKNTINTDEEKETETDKAADDKKDNGSGNTTAGSKNDGSNNAADVRKNSGSTKSTGSSKNSTANTPATGDTSSWPVWIAVLLLSAAISGILAAGRRRKY